MEWSDYASRRVSSYSSFCSCFTLIRVVEFSCFRSAGVWVMPCSWRAHWCWPMGWFIGRGSGRRLRSELRGFVAWLSTLFYDSNFPFSREDADVVRRTLRDRHRLHALALARTLFAGADTGVQPRRRIGIRSAGSSLRPLRTEPEKLN